MGSVRNVSSRRASDSRPTLTGLSNQWFYLAVLIPPLVAVAGLFIIEGSGNYGFQPEIGVSMVLLLAVWQERGLRAFILVSLALLFLGFAIPYWGWEVSIEISIVATFGHLMVAVVAVVLYLPLARLLSENPVGPVLALAASLLVAVILPALMIAAVTKDELVRDISYLQLSLLWGSAAFVGGMLVALVGLLLLPPYAEISRGTGRTGEGLLASTLVVIVATVVAITTTEWLLWALVPPLVWSALRCGPRWVAGQIAAVTVVFVVFAEEYQRGSPWLNVLAAQIAMLSLVFSVPVIALAVNGMRREAKRAAVALELAQRDSLTGLYNRRALNRIVDGALARAAKNQTQVGIVYLDIDKFKALNDALGHGAGDLVLAGVGKELRDSLRQTDSAFRVGGDEFVVVLSDLASASDLDAVVDSVRSNVNREFPVGGRAVSVSVSLGSALGYGSSDRDGLLAEADRALYQEKEFGPSV